MKNCSPELREIVYSTFTIANYRKFHPWWKCILKMREFEIVKYTQTERDEQVALAMENINYPIIELCEWLLVNDIESTGRDVCKFTCGVDFTVNRIYHLYPETNISPDISETKEEYRLLKACIWRSVRNTEKRLKQSERDKVGEFLKGVCV